MENKQIQPVRDKDWVSYRCRQCGQCCQNVKDEIMLESLDAYRLANYLLMKGETISGIEDVFNQYGIPRPLTVLGLPVFLLKTNEKDDSCVFLKNNRCSIYPVRPRTCRIYPFTVAPGERGKNFEYYLCTDKPYHLSEGRISVKDWMYQNFKQEDKEYVRQEFLNIAEIGSLMNRIGRSAYDRLLFPLLFYRYYNYDLQKPFMPQYESNHVQLLAELQRLI